MNKEERESLKKVLEYLSEEEKHYEEADKPDNHIHRHILALEKFTRRELTTKEQLSLALEVMGDHDVEKFETVSAIMENSDLDVWDALTQYEN